MTVVEALERELAGLPASVAGSALAAAAFVLARELDDPGNSATSKSMCAKALLDVTNRLRELAPAEQASDSVDDLQARRGKRLGRRAEAQG